MAASLLQSKTAQTMANEWVGKATRITVCNQWIGNGSGKDIQKKDPMYWLVLAALEAAVDAGKFAQESICFNHGDAQRFAKTGR